jgi:tetratricopeptide (TPR) repeat protein
MISANKILIVSIFLTCLAFPANAQKPVPAQPIRAMSISSEPGTILWIDDVRYGKTGKDGKLTVKTVARGPHTLRLRADGFKEMTRTITAIQKGEINVPLTKTQDEAELKYQEAERLSVTDRDKAAEAYRQAIKLRPGYTRAYIGLARVLSENSDTDAALVAIRSLRKASPSNAEASAIEGRLYKDNGDDAKAIAAFKRSIAEGKGFQPEAYTGLGLLYKERAEGFGGQGDIDKEAANYNESAKDFRIALRQLSGAPDASVLYQLLGLVLERQKKYIEAIELYQEFLRYFPDSNDAPAVQSFIEQLKKQMAEQE